MTIKKETIINADIKKVWNVFSELEKWPDWSGYHIDAKWNSKNKWKKGSEFMQHSKGFGIIPNFKSNSKIIEIEPYSRVTWAGTRSWIKGTHTLEFKKVRNKTKVINKEVFTGLLSPIFYPLIKKKFNEYFADFLIGLKKEAEKE